MPDILFSISLFALTYLAFALLAISQKRHWQSLTRFAPYPAVYVLKIRIAGYVLLAAALALALVQEGAGFGAVLWGTTISIGAAAVAATLAWRPRWLRPLVIQFRRH
jgi:hypothetical protein